MAKNKKIARNKVKGSGNVFKKGALCALLGTAMISGGLLVGCDSETGSIQAPAGTSFYYGATNPNKLDNPGKVGDFYIETDDGDVWQLGEEGWIHISNIKGPQGEVGPQGPQGEQGIQGTQGVGISSISTKSFCDADENMYMEITFTYSDGRSEVERVYLGHTIYVGSEMTLEKAVEAVADGGTIELTTDVQLEDQIVINKNVEIDLAGHVITNDEGVDIKDIENNKLSLISVRGGAELIISNETGTPNIAGIYAKRFDCYAIDVQEGSKCTINGGYIVGNGSAVYVQEGELIVNNGCFMVRAPQDPNELDYSKFTLDCFDENYLNETAKIVVNGGEFVNFNPSNNLSEGENTNYLSAGKTVSIDDTDSEIVVYTVVSQ